MTSEDYPLLTTMVTKLDTVHNEVTDLRELVIKTLAGEKLQDHRINELEAQTKARWEESEKWRREVHKDVLMVASTKPERPSPIIDFARVKVTLFTGALIALCVGALKFFGVDLSPYITASKGG